VLSHLLHLLGDWKQEKQVASDFRHAAFHLPGFDYHQHVKQFILARETKL
jgi:hypothetical protein